MSVGREGNETSMTAYDTVREQLYHDILVGNLQPGAKLTVAPLAKRYGTSSMPIRVALQELQGQGLVTIQPHQGARVRQIDEEDIVNIYELRRAIAGLLIPKSVRMISNADIEKLRVIEEKHADAITNRDLKGILKHNRAFQQYLFSLARNPEASGAMEKSAYLVDALRLMYGFGEERLKDVLVWHEKIIEGLLRRDTEETVAVYMESNLKAQEDLIRQLRKSKEKD